MPAFHPTLIGFCLHAFGSQILSLGKCRLYVNDASGFVHAVEHNVISGQVEPDFPFAPRRDIIELKLRETLI